MTYVEPQHNVAEATPAERGVWMTDEGKDADLQSGDTQPGAAKNPPSSHTQARRMRGGRSSPGTTDEHATAKITLNELTRNRIAGQLRTMYDTVVQQPVPDRFAELIARLDGDKGKDR